ncbi:MAG: hypothetical protein U0228_27810 [Myxococcaceae bacterium]
MSFAAFAQTNPQKPAQPKQPVTTMTFEEDLVEGGRKTPLGDIYIVVEPARFQSLIKIRQNFNDKLRESVNEM